MEYEEIKILMNQIEQAMKMSLEKEAVMNFMEDEVDQAQKDNKKEFDEMTINALIRAAKMIKEEKNKEQDSFINETLKVQTRKKELEKGKKVKELQAKKDEIYKKLASFENKEGIIQEELDKARAFANKGIQNVDVQINEAKSEISEELASLEDKIVDLKEQHKGRLDELDGYDDTVDKYALKLDAENEIAKARDEVEQSDNRIIIDDEPEVEVIGEQENEEPEEPEEIKEEPKLRLNIFDDEEPEEIEESDDEKINLKIDDDDEPLRIIIDEEPEEIKENEEEIKIEKPDLEATENISMIQEAINAKYEIVVNNTGVELTINGEKVLVDDDNIRNMMEIQKKNPKGFMDLIGKYSGLIKNEFKDIKEAKKVLTENGIDIDKLKEIDPMILACANKLTKINQNEKGAVLLSNYLDLYQGIVTKDDLEKLSITYDLDDLSKKSGLLQRLFTTKNYFNLENKLEIVERAEKAKDLGIAKIKGEFTPSRMDKFFGRFEKNNKKVKLLGAGPEKEPEEIKEKQEESKEEQNNFKNEIKVNIKSEEAVENYYKLKEEIMKNQKQEKEEEQEP